VNEPFRNLDESIERFLRWRASRAEPMGLLEQIRRELELEPRRYRRFASSGRVFTMGRLAWVGLLIALLAAAAFAATIGGGARGLLGTTPTATPAPPAAQGAPLYLYCTHPRDVPFDPSKLDLTGTWTDRSEMFFLRQQGDVVWGVGIGLLGWQNMLPLSGGRYTAVRGTVGTNSAIHLDLGETGMVDPADRSFAPSLANGSIDLRAERGPDGNLQLTTVSQSGAIIEGPAFSTPVFSPCTPTSAP
jgi:hypothetical protein